MCALWSTLGLILFLVAFVFGDKHPESSISQFTNVVTEISVKETVNGRTIQRKPTPEEIQLMEKNILGTLMDETDKKLPNLSYVEDTTTMNDLVDLESFMPLDAGVTDDDAFDKYMVENDADIDDVFSIFENDETLFNTNNNPESIPNSGEKTEQDLFEGSGDGEVTVSTSPVSVPRNRNPNQLIDFMEEGNIDFQDEEGENATQRTYSVVASTNTSTTSINVTHSTSSNNTEDIFAGPESDKTTEKAPEEDNLAENGISIKDFNEITSLLAEKSQAIQFDDNDDQEKEQLYESGGFINSHSFNKEQLFVATQKQDESEPSRPSTNSNELLVDASTVIIDANAQETTTTKPEVTEQATQTTTVIFETPTEILMRSEHVVDSFTTPSPDDNLNTLPTSFLNNIQAELGSNLDGTPEIRIPDRFKPLYSSVVVSPTEVVTVLSSIDIFGAVNNNGSLSASRELTPSEVESMYNQKIEENEAVEEADGDDDDDSGRIGLTLDEDSVWDEVNESVEPSTKVPEVITTTELIELERESKKLKYVPCLNTTILNHPTKFSVLISRQHYSMYIPSSAYVRQYSDIVNITWRLDENKNNSLALKVQERDHFYVIKEFLLNILLDNYYIVQKKHIRVTANLHELMQPVEVKLRDDVVLTFSNVDFLKKPIIKKDITGYTAKEQLTWGIQVASICSAALLISSLTFYIVLKRKSRVALREKADIPQIHHC